MTRVLLVGLGGMIGSMLRFGLGELIQLGISRERFPAGTFLVNIVGCLIIGLLARLAETRAWFNEQWRVFTMIGILGGFTTFSSFGNESINLMREGSHLTAWLNIMGQVVLGLTAVWLGRYLAMLIWE